jgi:fumarylacetoacetase
MGQTKADDADAPTFGPSRLLDFELEMGFFVGQGNQPGTRVSTGDAREHIFGMVLLNDWSARDIQKWEYVPLGPFLGKSFATSISPWVVTLDALEPFRTAGPTQEPPVLPYLQCAGDAAYDIDLQAFVQAADMDKPMRLTRTNFKYMYWNMLQQLAHHTCNGTGMRVGDLCGSGTISGSAEDSRGSMLEICWKGTKPITLPNGAERKFFADGDTVIIKGHCQGDGYRVGFGEVCATILPAIS